MIVHQVILYKELGKLNVVLMGNGNNKLLVAKVRTLSYSLGLKRKNNKLYYKFFKSYHRYTVCLTLYSSYILLQFQNLNLIAILFLLMSD